MCDINWGQVFEDIDKNKSGVLELEELFGHLNQIFPTLSIHTVECDFEEYDTNKDGQVTKPEFVRAMYKRYLQDPDDIALAFKTFDTDGSGCLSEEELKAAMKKMYMDYHDEKYKDIIARLTKCGKIDYKEFAQAAMKL